MILLIKKIYVEISELEEKESRKNNIIMACLSESGKTEMMIEKNMT